MNQLQRILDELINNEKTGHAGFRNYSPATMRFNAAPGGAGTYPYISRELTGRAQPRT